MKQRSIGVHAIKMIVRQIELEEILQPYFAATVGARHHGEMSGTFQTYSYVTKFRKHLEVATGAAAKIQDRKRRFTSRASSRRSASLRSCSLWVDAWAASSEPPFTESKAACLRTRSPWAVVNSVLSWSRREERMLVFSSGLMTLKSLSNCARAAEERSILALSSSICFSMKEERPAAAVKRILYVCRM